MSKDLGLDVGLRYSIITLVFFATYVVFQFPSTLVIKQIGPRIHLSLITLAWGAVMIGYDTSVIERCSLTHLSTSSKVYGFTNPLNLRFMDGHFH
jgi:hypothetical protein